MNDFKWHALSEQCSPVFRHISIKFHVCCKSWLGGANELALLAGCSLSSVMVGAMPLHADWFIHSHSLNHFRWTGRCSFHHSHVSSQVSIYMLTPCQWSASNRITPWLPHGWPLYIWFIICSLWQLCPWILSVVGSIWLLGLTNLVVKVLLNELLAPHRSGGGRPAWNIHSLVQV